MSLNLSELFQKQNKSWNFTFSGFNLKRQFVFEILPVHIQNCPQYRTLPLEWHIKHCNFMMQAPSYTHVCDIVTHVTEDAVHALQCHKGHFIICSPLFSPVAYIVVPLDSSNYLGYCQSCVLFQKYSFMFWARWPFTDQITCSQSLQLQFIAVCPCGFSIISVNREVYFESNELGKKKQSKNKPAGFFPPSI